jgi:ATP-dependent exoDNAse (exonuclease V) alpha subunit
LYVLSAASVAQAKVVLVGDDCQLGPVGLGGAFGALLERHRGLVHVLAENVRQFDPDERQALAELRAGNVAAAVDWYAKHDRIRLSADRDEAIGATVERWAADIAHGRDAVMVAWRRSSVQQLNPFGRQAWLALGQLSGPELVATGGRHYRAGDRIVTLAPTPDDSLVTSQHGTVTMANPLCGALIARMDDGGLHRLEGDQLAADRLDYAYALTVHRWQGLTTETCHHLADGGGRNWRMWP